jgi:hypothetical protein
MRGSFEATLWASYLPDRPEVKRAVLLRQTNRQIVWRLDSLVAHGHDLGRIRVFRGVVYMREVRVG